MRQYEKTLSPTRNPSGYTVDELSRKVGMSPRNIRAHQARKLLPPPVRRGRVAYYEEAHVRRLETIKGLQRQGFNLVSIEAMLGTGRPERGVGNLEQLLNRLEADQPALLYTLLRHGVVGRDDDGTIRALRPRVLHGALDLHRVGLPPVAALRLLTELLDTTREAGRALVSAAGGRVRALRPASIEAEPDAEVLGQGLVTVLVEALRVNMESQSAGLELAERPRWGGQNSFL